MTSQPSALTDEPPGAPVAALVRVHTRRVDRAGEHWQVGLKSVSLIQLPLPWVGGRGAFNNTQQGSVDLSLAVVQCRCATSPWTIPGLLEGP